MDKWRMYNRSEIILPSRQHTCITGPHGNNSLISRLYANIKMCNPIYVEGDDEIPEIIKPGNTET